MTKDPALRAGLGVALPFFARRLWVSLRRRPGAAPRVDFDPEALQRSPGVTWIGHATFLVRMDEATFLTDPMFSERASPLSFAGPPRLVPPGVPLDALAPGGLRPRLPRPLRSRGPALAARARRAGHAHRRAPGHGRRRARGGRGGHRAGLVGGHRDRGRRACTACPPSISPDAASPTATAACGRAGWSRERRRRFYHAGDTGYFGGFTDIGARPRTLRPRRHPRRRLSAVGDDAARAPDPEEAVQAALDLKASRALAMHFGTFDLTDEPLDEPPARFLAEAARRGPRRPRLGACGSARHAPGERSPRGAVVVCWKCPRPPCGRRGADDPARDRARPRGRPPLRLPRRERAQRGLGRRSRRPHRHRQRRTRGVRLRPRHPRPSAAASTSAGASASPAPSCPSTADPCAGGSAGEPAARYQGRLDRQKLEFTVTDRGTDGPGPFTVTLAQGAEADEVPVSGRP